jgi:hypothetical protein
LNNSLVTTDWENNNLVTTALAQKSIFLRTAFSKEKPGNNSLVTTSHENSLIKKIQAGKNCQGKEHPSKDSL